MSSHGGRPWEEVLDELWAKGWLIRFEEDNQDPTLSSNVRQVELKQRRPPMRLLLVEDELKHVRFIRRGLEEELFAVDVAVNGEEALDLVEAASYDLIILDLMPPKCDGFEVLKCLRARKYLIPVLILTAKTSIEGKLKGFQLGTDDYLTKPFAFAELVARIRNLVRRNGPSQSLTLKVGDLTLDPLTRTVRRGQQLIALTNKEFSILV
jgi:two-component system copper resistance phosphate regulon response regulator CusR